MDNRLILKQLQTQEGFKNKIDFANFLGISESTFRSWQRGQAMDLEILKKKIPNLESRCPALFAKDSSAEAKVAAKVLSPEEVKGMSIKERLRYFVTTMGITKTDFYKATGLSNGMLDKGCGISALNIQKILQEYPNLDSAWLVNGEGSMLVDPELGNVVVGEDKSGTATFLDLVSGKIPTQVPAVDSMSMDELRRYITDTIPSFIEAIKEKDDQIRRKDEQIAKLLDIVAKSQK